MALPRRPVECSSAKDVNVQVIDRLAAISATIDDGAVSVRQTKLLGDFLRGQQQVPQQSLILTRSCREVCQFFFGDHQHMRRSLRRDVMKCQAQIIFMDDLSRDFPIEDPFENRRHREHRASA